jgi:hypothetical protein
VLFVFICVIRGKIFCPVHVSASRAIRGKKLILSIAGMAGEDVEKSRVLR